MHSIQIKHVREYVHRALESIQTLTEISHSLPADLFVPGEKIPTKKKKKSKKEPAQAVDNKRSADAAGLDVSIACLCSILARMLALLHPFPLTQKLTADICR